MNECYCFWVRLFTSIPNRNSSCSINALLDWVSSVDMWYLGIPKAAIDGVSQCWDGEENLRIPIVVIHSDKKGIPQRSSTDSNPSLLSVIFSLGSISPLSFILCSIFFSSTLDCLQGRMMGSQIKRDDFSVMWFTIPMVSCMLGFDDEFEQKTPFLSC